MTTAPQLLREAVRVAPALLLVSAAVSVSAECLVTDPVFLAEGPISAVTAADGVAPDGVTATVGTITSMGVVIHVPPEAPVTSPTAILDMATFADATPFPGRDLGGYLGATVISEGCVKFSAADPLVPFALAENVFSDVAENVMLGVVTGPFVAGTGTLEVNGTPVALLSDARMPNLGINNPFGLPVTTDSITVGGDIAVEGYYGDDGTLHVWDVEVANGTLVDAVNPQISIQRFRCANEIRVLGGIYLGTPTCSFNGYAIDLFDGVGNPLPIDNLDVLDGLAPDPAFCSYDLQVAVDPCPESIRVVLRQGATPLAEATAP